MLRLTNVFAWALAFTMSCLVITSCSKDEDDNETITTPVPLTDGSMTYKINGESVQAKGLVNVNCTYSEDQNHFWVYGITGFSVDPSTNLPTYDHRLDFMVSNLENLQDLVGQTIPFYSDTTSAGEDVFFSSIYSAKQSIITTPISASLTITSVSNNKLVGTFNADFGSIIDETTVTHEVTNGAFNSINILIY